MIADSIAMSLPSFHHKHASGLERVPGRGCGEGIFVSEARRTCPSSCLPVRGRDGVALPPHSQTALTLSYQDHLMEGVGSRIGSAQLIGRVLEWC